MEWLIFPLSYKNQHDMCDHDCDVCDRVRNLVPLSNCLVSKTFFLSLGTTFD